MEILSDVDTGQAFPQRTMGKVLCCLCGVDIDPNPANMCVNCLRNQVDITEGIPKQIILHHCRGCDRYLRPPWCACDLESRELLAICLKKITGLGKVRLVDAGFIWTEPHSRRLKVKLVIQKEVLNGVRLQQVFAVEFVMQNQQCDACQRSYTDHTWRAMVQVRQRVDHKKTFFLLEQLILKHRAHEKCINVEQVPSGVDFSFGERSHALKFLDFLGCVVPTKSKSAKQLISEDTQTSVKNFKFTFAVEIVPLCRDDLVVLPAKTASVLGAMNPLALVQRVSNHIFFVDPRSLQMGEINSERYWHEPFRPLLPSDRLEEFTVLDVTAVTIAPLTGTALRRKQGKRAGSKITGGSSGASKRGGDDDSDDDDGFGDDGDDLAGAGTATGSRANTGSIVGMKRKRTHDDDNHSTIGASSVAGGTTYAGGYTGAVSLHGGSIQFHGASSIASTVTGGPKGKMLLADAEVIKTKDMGKPDAKTHVVRTHLGNLLRSGDLVLGYDLTNAVYNDADAESSTLGGKSKARGVARASSKFELPDIVLVRKTYRRKDPTGRGGASMSKDDVDALEGGADGASSVMSRKERRIAARAAKSAGSAGGAGAAASNETEMADSSSSASALGPAVPRSGGTPGVFNPQAAAAKRRVWKLKRFDDVGVPTYHSDINRKGDEAKRAAEFESFMREIEDDPVLRKTLNLYKDQQAIDARRAAGTLKEGSAAAKKGRGAAPPKVPAASSAAPAGSGTTAAASSAHKGSLADLKKAKAEAAAAAAAGGDDDDAEEEEAEIGLEELLDDLNLKEDGGGSGGEGSGGEEGAEAKTAKKGGASSASAGAGGAGAKDDGEDGEDDGAAAAAAAEGAYLDPEDAKILAEYKARQARAKKLKEAFGGGSADDDEDEDDGAKAKPSSSSSGAAAAGSAKPKLKRRDTGIKMASSSSSSSSASSSLKKAPLPAAIPEDGDEEDEDGDEL